MCLKKICNVIPFIKNMEIIVMSDTPDVWELIAKIPISEWDRFHSVQEKMGHKRMETTIVQAMTLLDEAFTAYANGHKVIIRYKDGREEDVLGVKEN